MPSGSDGEAVTVANGAAVADERVREHDGGDLRRVDVACDWVSPSGQPVDRGAVPDDERRVEAGERVRGVARRRRHRRGEHDDVRTRLAQERRVRAVAVARRTASMPGVDDLPEAASASNGK